MSADVPIPHPYTGPTTRGAFCPDCLAYLTDPTFAEHHTMPDTITADLPAGAIVDDDLDGLADELEAEYAAAVARRVAR